MNFAKAGLSMFPWEHIRLTNAAVKMHTLLDLCGCIPNFSGRVALWTCDICVASLP